MRNKKLFVTYSKSYSPSTGNVYDNPVMPGKLTQTSLRKYFPTSIYESIEYKEVKLDINLNESFIHYLYENTSSEFKNGRTLKEVQGDWLASLIKGAISNDENASH